MPSTEGFDQTSKAPSSKVLEGVRQQALAARTSSPSNSSSGETDGSDGEVQQPPRVTRFASSVRTDVDGTPALSRGLQQLSFDDEQDDVNTMPVNGSAGTGSRHASGSYSNSPTSSAYPATPYGGQAYQAPTARSREGSASSQLGALDTSVSAQPNGYSAAPRLQRPGVARTPSNAYAPPRRPTQFASTQSHLGRHRSSSSQQRPRRNPEADYQAQKKAYIQRLNQDNADEDNMLVEEVYPPSTAFSSEGETDDESPATADYVSNDPYDQEAMMYLGNDDISPSAEELKVPANRERLEWHSMLANVLTGDVVRQEKKRMTGPTEQATDTAIRYDLWVGVRAKTCGRPVAAHKRLLEEQRAKAGTLVEDIIAFEIKGEAEVGMTPADQVADICKQIEKLERLYPTTIALEAAQARAASEAYKDTVAAVTSWQNIMTTINTEIGILQNWVGNDRLELAAPREKKDNESHLTDDSSFLDRILKEDGLKSIGSEHSLLVGVNEVIGKAKTNVIENADAYAKKHLPSYIEELLTLIAFPSRVVQEIIRMRLQYAERIKDPAQQGVLMAETMIPQFQILLKLAVKVKEEYLVVSQPEAGWDLPPCLDENFDQVVLGAIEFYFKMLGWQMSATKNQYKEAEILEQEWGFLNAQAQAFDGGDVMVAEQFSKLTAKALDRLTGQFRVDLRKKDNEVAGPEMDKRYKGILDSVRVRQRKLFRFSRQLTNTFENTTEYSINMAPHLLQELYDNLTITGHVLVNVTTTDNDRISVLASPTLADMPQEIISIAGTCYRADNAPNDANNPYVLLLYPEEPLFWSGPTIDLDMKLPKTDLKPGKLRLVARGGNINSNNGKNQLEATKLAFLQATGFDLDVTVPQRANVPSVDHRLRNIKKSAFGLSKMIMDSVDLIRNQLAGLECQELIQNCFAFATEFGQRSVMYMDYNRRALNNLKLTQLALEWVSFICDDCIAADRKTFRWAVTALEFAMIMTRGQNILSISAEDYASLRTKVAGCMSLLISHFDIMGARSTVAAQMKNQSMLDAAGNKFRIDISKMMDEEESAALLRQRWVAELTEIDEVRKEREAERRALGRVLEDNNEADRSLTFLSSAATSATLRWQQGQYIGGGTFGSVYVATNLDTGYLMAVKEIRLQDPQMIPTIAAQIRDEMSVLQMLDHPNVASYYGIEVHRDKVYIFMQYCSNGSLANLLEHGRIEDEQVIQVYTLQMLEGLAYLHESGVIHRDIKPENILLDHMGLIKYIDFGAAKVITRQNGRTLAAEHPAGAVQRGKQNSMTGTPMYMSPEVIRGSSTFSNGQAGDKATPARPGAVDTWSLGCVVLEMATGRRPWANLDNEWAIMYNIAQGNPPQLPTRDQLSDMGIDFLKKCFERDPAKRASAAELLQHEWIMSLRSQLSLAAPQTPSTDSGEMTPGALSHTSTRSSYRDSSGGF